MDHFRFVQTLDALSQSIIIAVALATHRRINVSFDQAFGVARGNIGKVRDSELTGAIRGELAVSTIQRTRQRPDQERWCAPSCPGVHRAEPGDA